MISIAPIVTSICALNANTVANMTRQREEEEEEYRSNSAKTDHSTSQNINNRTNSGR